MLAEFICLVLSMPSGAKDVFNRQPHALRLTKTHRGPAMWTPLATIHTAQQIYLTVRTKTAQHERALSLLNHVQMRKLQQRLSLQRRKTTPQLTRLPQQMSPRTLPHLRTRMQLPPPLTKKAPQRTTPPLRSRARRLLHLQPARKASSQPLPASPQPMRL